MKNFKYVKHIKGYFLLLNFKACVTPKHIFTCLIVFFQGKMWFIFSPEGKNYLVVTAYILSSYFFKKDIKLEWLSRRESKWSQRLETRE